MKRTNKNIDKAIKDVGNLLDILDDACWKWQELARINREIEQKKTIRMRTILKELGVSREQIIDYCRLKYPHLFHKRVYVKLRDWKPKLEESKSVEVEFCEVCFKILLLKYLSDHNFKVTGSFASAVKGW